jgi:hypothetical protein
MTGKPTRPALAALAPAQIDIAVSGWKESFPHGFETVHFETSAFGITWIICATFSANVDHLLTDHVDVKWEFEENTKGKTDSNGALLGDYLGGRLIMWIDKGKREGWC